MRIKKDNIVIRSATIDDAIQLNKWWNDGKIMEHAGYPNGLGESLKDTIRNIKRFEGQLSQLCMIEVDGKSVGELSYSIKDDNAAYPGWKICDVNYQNKGYGPQIIRMLFEFIFTDEVINSTVPINKIVWDTALENRRAQYVYENKIGATKTNVRENAWHDQLGNWRTAVDYEIIKEDFINRIDSKDGINKQCICGNSRVEINPYKESDYQSFVCMFHSYFLDDFQIKIKDSQIEKICTEIIETTNRQIGLLDILKVNNEPKGFIIYQIDSPKSDWCQKEGFGFIREMYIQKELRRKGLGKLLAANVEQTLKNFKVDQIYLTSDDNGEFWMQCGFAKTNEVGYMNQDPIYMKSINQ